MLGFRTCYDVRHNGENGNRVYVMTDVTAGTFQSVCEVKYDGKRGRRVYVIADKMGIMAAENE